MKLWDAFIQALKDAASYWFGKKDPIPSSTPVVSIPVPVLQSDTGGNVTPTEKLSDVEEKLLSEMYPKVAVMIRMTIINAKKGGMNVGLYSGVRTFKEQDILYLEGRDAAGNVVDASAVVTNAKGGMSYHNYGVAGDIVFKDSKGNWTWDIKDEMWAKLGLIGQTAGLDWGIKINKTKLDEDHFQYTKGLPNLPTLRTLYYKSNSLEDIWKMVT